MTLRARFVANWVYPDCQWPDEEECAPTTTLHFQIWDMWRAPLMHINSVDDKDIFENDGGLIQITGDLVNPANRKLQAYRISDSYFSTSCSSFSFKNFPFDQLTCDIIIDVDMTNDVLQVVEAMMDIDKSQAGIIDPADVWEFIAINTTVVEVPYIDGLSQGKDRIFFTMTLKRKYQYYIINILLPIWLLFVLQISILILPPDCMDRPSYSVTVVLAYAVSLTYVLGQIPQTTETVYLIVLIDLHIVVSVVMTIYLFIISNLEESGDAKRLRNFDRIFGISTFLLVLFKDVLLILFMIYDV